MGSTSSSSASVHGLQDPQLWFDTRPAYTRDAGSLRRAYYSELLARLRACETPRQWTTVMRRANTKWPLMLTKSAMYWDPRGSEDLALLGQIVAALGRMRLPVPSDDDETIATGQLAVTLRFLLACQLRTSNEVPSVGDVVGFFREALEHTRVANVGSVAQIDWLQLAAAEPDIFAACVDVVKRMDWGARPEDAMTTSHMAAMTVLMASAVVHGLDDDLMRVFETPLAMVAMSDVVCATFQCVRPTTFRTDPADKHVVVMFYAQGIKRKLGYRMLTRMARAAMTAGPFAIRALADTVLAMAQICDLWRWTQGDATEMLTVVLEHLESSPAPHAALELALVLASECREPLGHAFAPVVRTLRRLLETDNTADERPHHILLMSDKKRKLSPSLQRNPLALHATTEDLVRIADELARQVQAALAEPPRHATILALLELLTLLRARDAPCSIALRAVALDLARGGNYDLDDRLAVGYRVLDMPRWEDKDVLRAALRSAVRSASGVPINQLCVLLALPMERGDYMDLREVLVSQARTEGERRDIVRFGQKSQPAEIGRLLD